jgi:hypothetical protein
MGEPSVSIAGLVQPAPFSNVARMKVQNPDWVIAEGKSREALVIAVEAFADETGLQALGIPLVKGRFFSAQDLDIEAGLSDTRLRAKSQTVNMPRQSSVAVITRSLAARLWPFRDPIGMRFDGSDGVRRQVVGVVEDFHLSAVSLVTVPGAFYPFTADHGSGTLAVRMKAEVPVESVAAAIAARLHRSPPTGVRITVHQMDRDASDALRTLELAMGFVGAFAVMGVAVAAVGVYFIVASAVNGSRRETSIRMALGETPIRALLRTLRTLTRVAVSTLVIGSLLALAAERLLQVIASTEADSWRMYVTTWTVFIATLTFVALVPVRRMVSEASRGAIRNL